MDLEAEGVEFRTSKEVGVDLSFQSLKENFDAVVLSGGAEDVAPIWRDEEDETEEDDEEVTASRGRGKRRARPRVSRMVCTRHLCQRARFGRPRSACLPITTIYGK